LHAAVITPLFAASGDALIRQARNQNLTDSSIRSYAAQQIQFHIDTNDINQIVISNNQLLLSLIPSLLLIGVGLIGFGKRTGLAKI
jgi:hypothetical protein